MTKRLVANAATGQTVAEQLTPAEISSKTQQANDAAAARAEQRIQEAELRSVPKWAKALAIWIAQREGITVAQLRSEVRAIYEGLQE